MIVVCDAEGRVIRANRKAQELCGRNPVLRPFEAAFPLRLTSDGPSQAPAGDQQTGGAGGAFSLSTVTGGGADWSGEVTFTRPDGQVFSLLLNAGPLHGSGGRPLGNVVTLTDITERKRAEAEAASRLKDEFLATLSHELRNPLNSIIGHAEVLARKPDADGIKRSAESIRRNALSQAELISDLLDLSRLQTGKLALDWQPINLASVIGDAVDSLRPQAKAKKIRLGFHVTPEPLMTEADPVRVQQIVWNLLANAIKFTPDGGKITVNLSREEKEAKLVVKDTGQGINPGFLEHIFEMFRQGDVGTTRKHGGMGIGLALVRQLVELHGGRVEARSEGVGLGASFSVWLPLDAAAPEAARLPAAREAASGRLASLRILVVDDTPDTVDVLQDMLELEGALVTTASSGAEALEIAGAVGFDLILSDVSMPEMDGYQLLEELRKGGRSAGVPAIALTGLGRPEDVERARAIGFTTHLTKPVTLDKLIKVARAAARQDVRPKISTSIKSSQG